VVQETETTVLARQGASRGRVGSLMYFQASLFRYMVVLQSFRYYRRQEDKQKDSWSESQEARSKGAGSWQLS